MTSEPTSHNVSAKGLWQVLSSMIWLGMWCLAIGLLVTILLLRWWPGDRLLAVRMINYAMPWFLAVLLPALALYWLAGHRWLALTLGLSAAYIVTVYLPLFLPNSQIPEPTSPPLKVMSFNVWSHNRQTEEIARVILAERPDLLLLQEIPAERLDALRTLLSTHFPIAENQFAYNRKGLLATLSRFPLEPLAVQSERAVQKVRVETPGEPVTVYNVHFLRTVLRHRTDWQRRHDQIAKLLGEEISHAEGAVILAGDFNLTDQTETYRMIRNYLQDAHWQAGSGFGFTYPSPNRKLKGSLSLPAMVRIDHLFYNRELTALTARTLQDAGGSDHLPITGTFSLHKG